MYHLNQTKFLTPLEIRSLEVVLKDPSRNSLMISIALNTGARATELLNLTKQDVFIDSKTILIKGIKQSNDREIPLHHDLFKRLENHIESLELKDRLFKISYPRLIQIWHFYRPALKKFHSLRHTFAIELYKRQRDLRLVQVALGHRSIQNTMIYANYLFSREELNRIIA